MKTKIILHIENIVLRFIRLSLLALMITLSTEGCRKHNEIPEENTSNDKVLLKGRIPEGKKLSDSLTLADAKNVLIFNPNTFSQLTHYRNIEIVNGEFSSEVPTEASIAVVFLNEEYKYIGNLYTEGLNMLPLGNLTNKDRTTIDLGILSLDGKHVLPSQNPLGVSIVITTPEIESFIKLGGYFEYLEKNVDADNDEGADILFSRQIIVSTNFRLYLGRWGCDDTVAASVETSELYINQLLNIEGGLDYTISNSNITLSGPADSAYNDIKLLQYTINPNERTGFTAQFIREYPAEPGAPWTNDLLPFKRGLYTLSTDGTTPLTFKYSNTDAKYGVIIATPTLHTNGDGLVTSITFIYSLPNGLIIYPNNMIANVFVKIYNSSGNVIQPPTMTNKNDFYEIKLSQPFELSGLARIEITYDDLVGNKYYITWR